MVPKPDACAGCPFFARGRSYVPDEIVEDAPVMILGQNPGADEEAQGRPFVGRTGQMQETDFFPLAGLARGQVSIGNAIRCRLDGGNTLPPVTSRELRAALAHCTRAHLRVPERTRVVLAQGEYALLAATGETAITDCRGWALPWNPWPWERPREATVWTPGPGDRVVLPTYHLAYLFRDPRAKVPVMRDWTKIPLILAGTWPEPFPAIRTALPGPIGGVFAFDTEFVPDTGHLIRYSLAARDSFVGTQVYVIEGAQRIPLLGGRASGALSVELAAPHVIMHNAPADLAYWERLAGLAWGGYYLDDTLQMHATLWGGLPHSLDFVASMYARTNRWKHLERVNPVVYSAGDALGTWDAWVAMGRELARDPGSEATYRERKLRMVPIIRRAQDEGLRVDQARVVAALEALARHTRRAELRASAAVGWPINLASHPQVAFQLYRVEGLRRGRWPENRS